MFRYRESKGLFVCMVLNSKEFMAKWFLTKEYKRGEKYKVEMHGTDFPRI